LFAIKNDLPSNAKEVGRMRNLFTYTLTLSMGMAIAFGIAWLVGLIWQSAKFPVFLIISIWWAWNGWRYLKKIVNCRFASGHGRHTWFVFPVTTKRLCEWAIAETHGS